MSCSLDNDISYKYNPKSLIDALSVDKELQSVLCKCNLISQNKIHTMQVVFPITIIIF